MILFRADKRDFNVGDIVTTAGDYYGLFKPDAQLIEDQFDAFQPESKPRRRDHLFLFESIVDAKNYWSIMSNGKLYKVEIADNRVLHRGDMHWCDVIKSQNKAGEPTAESYRSYWNSIGTGQPCFEVLVESAIVIDVISKSEEERVAHLRQRWGFVRDLPVQDSI